MEYCLLLILTLVIEKYIDLTLNLGLYRLSILPSYGNESSSGIYVKISDSLMTLLTSFPRVESYCFLFSMR